MEARFVNQLSRKNNYTYQLTQFGKAGFDFVVPALPFQADLFAEVSCMECSNLYYQSSEVFQKHFGTTGGVITLSYCHYKF